MNKKIIGIVFVAVFTALTLFILLTSEEISTFPDFIKNVNSFFLACAIGCMIVYLIVNAIIIYAIGRELDRGFHFKSAVYLSFVGQYYSLITPFASGGQPAQIYGLKTKYNMSIPKATSLTVKKFIIFQTVISLYSIFMFFFKLQFITKEYGPIILFIIIGLIVNLFGCVFIITLAYSRSLVNKILGIFMKIIKKLRIIKKFNEEKLYDHIDEYASCIQDIKNNKDVMIYLTLLTVLQLTVYFSITYFIYLAFGLNGAGYFDILAIQTVVYVVVSFIPTPGGAGASEGSFYVLFKVFFPKTVLLYAVALWRIIVYYGNMILSGIIVLIDKLRRRRA